MTKEKFIEELEGYYGASLPERARMYTENYLNRYRTEALTELLMVVLMHQPLKFGTPAMATIEEAHKEYCKDHESLKRTTMVSATRPIDDAPEISEEEREEVQAMMRETGGILGLIARGAV